MLNVYGHRWREVQLVMVNTRFTSYIDDSGTSPDHRVATATALVIPGARLNALEGEWLRLKTKEGLTTFHTSECLARNRKSEFANWEDGKPERVLKRVRQIGKKYGAIAFSYAVNKSHYDTLVHEELKSHVGGHYTWTIRHIIAALDKWAAITKMSEPFEYVFDWIDPKSQREARDEINTVMAQVEDASGNTGRYANYSFRRRPDVIGLQCVDALAWTCYQQALFAHFNVPLKNIALESWKDYVAYCKGEWLGAFFMTREQLADWAEREEKDGRSLERFKAWEAKHPKKKSQKART